jgi:hypothetical protein
LLVEFDQGDYIAEFDDQRSEILSLAQPLSPDLEIMRSLDALGSNAGDRRVCIARFTSTDAASPGILPRLTALGNRVAPDDLAGVAVTIVGEIEPDRLTECRLALGANGIQKVCDSAIGQETYARVVAAQLVSLTRVEESGLPRTTYADIIEEEASSMDAIYVPKLLRDWL